MAAIGSPGKQAEQGGPAAVAETPPPPPQLAFPSATFALLPDCEALADALSSSAPAAVQLLLQRVQIGAEPRRGRARPARPRNAAARSSSDLATPNAPQPGPRPNARGDAAAATRGRRRSPSGDRQGSGRGHRAAPAPAGDPGAARLRRPRVLRRFFGVPRALCAVREDAGRIAGLPATPSGAGAVRRNVGPGVSADRFRQCAHLRGHRPLHD